MPKIKSIDEKTQVVELGDKEELLENMVYAHDINYVSLDSLKPDDIVFAKIRYSDKAAPAKVIYADDKRIQINYLEPKNAVTPGQSIVIYNEQGYVLAGGIIEKAPLNS